MVNPTKYWIYPRLYNYDYKNEKEKPMNFTGNEDNKMRGIVEPTNSKNIGVQQSGLEFDQGKPEISFRVLYWFILQISKFKLDYTNWFT